MISRPALGLHPLRFCRGLALAASLRGAKLHSASEVLDWSRSADGGHRLQTAGGTLRASKVLFATNGFMPEQLRSEFYGRTLPVVSAIVVTRPLTDDERLEAQYDLHSTSDPMFKALELGTRAMVLGMRIKITGKHITIWRGVEYVADEPGDRLGYRIQDQQWTHIHEHKRRDPHNRG